MTGRGTTRYADIAVGDVYSFEQVLERQHGALFAELTGDATDTGTLHGMLAASFFSALIDIYGPGPDSVHVSQTLQFRKPLRYGETVTVRGEILTKSNATRIITIQTDILSGSEKAITGEAKIQLPR